MTSASVLLFNGFGDVDCALVRDDRFLASHCSVPLVPSFFLLPFSDQLLDFWNRMTVLNFRITDCAVTVILQYLSIPA